MNIKWSQRLRALAGLCWFWIGELEIYIHISESSGDFITRRILKVFLKTRSITILITFVGGSVV